MDAKKLVELAEYAGLDARSYSGRGMYGDECVAITCDDPLDCILDLINACVEMTNDVDEIAECIEDLRNPRTDSMGLSSVVYWPRIKWEGMDEDKDEEESDDE